MISLSPAKINLGLRVTGKREDGFHTLQSIMIPVPFCDIIEIVPAHGKENNLEFTQSGIITDASIDENLCVKAFNLFSNHHSIGSAKIHLHKQIPFGAGLGGGSSNASTVLDMLNEMHYNHFTLDELGRMASDLGSDCPFFLHHQPMLMEGRGEILSKTELDLSGLYAVILNPGIIISTAEAFQLISPGDPVSSLSELILEPGEKWKKSISNDFESSLFPKYPELEALKNGLYTHGAIYASMSGSGSSIYGLFRGRPILPVELKTKKIWEGLLEPVRQIL